MDRIAVFIKNYVIGNSSSIINFLDLMSEYFKVELYLRKVRKRNAEVLKKENINVIDVSGDSPLENIRQEPVLDETEYKCFVCFDTHGFFLCKDLFPDARPLYYSLEINMKDDVHISKGYSKEVLDIERQMLNCIKGFIITSDEREALFRKNYNLCDNVPSLIVPVTYKGKSVSEKSQKVRDKYGISSDKKIALHLGTIVGTFSCIELAVAFSQIKDWVLLFHGYPSSDTLRKLKRTIYERGITNVIISRSAYSNIDDIDDIVSSCDIGVAWYNDYSLNHSTAGKSSGKISAYLRFGLPVITKRYPSTTEAIEKTGTGVCVDSFDEIGKAIETIEKSYKIYSINAREEYDKTYWFENYKKHLIDFIELCSSE